MKITAVLTSYWHERLQNVPQIITNLKGSSVPPDEIILLNNNPEYTIGRKDIKVINSMHNWGAEGRYAAALLEPSDYYFLIDDDLTVKEHTIRNLARQAQNYPNMSLGLIGRKVGKGKKYSEGKIVNGDEIDKFETVDCLIRCYFVPQGAAASAATAMKSEYEGLDDLVLATVSNCRVIPAKEDEFIENMDSGGVGYEKREDHYERRNKFFAEKLSK